jgi:hypothetical protein
MITPELFLSLSIAWLLFLRVYVMRAIRTMTEQYDFMLDHAVPALEAFNPTIQRHALKYPVAFCLTTLLNLVALRKWLALFTVMIGLFFFAIPHISVNFLLSGMLYASIIMVSASVVNFTHVRRTQKTIGYSASVLNTLVKGLIISNLGSKVPAEVVEDVHALTRVCERSNTWRTLFDIEDEDERNI